MNAVVSGTHRRPAEAGRSLFDYADDLAVLVPSSCGRTGRCHECIVEVKAGAAALSPRSEAEGFLKDQFRLACQAEVVSTEAEIAFAPLRRRPKILTTFDEPASARPVDPAVTRAGDKVLLDGREIDTFRGHICGMAIDLGTTTVVIDLIDLETGHTIARSAFENPQRFGGSDVMSRISYDRTMPGELQKAIIRAINSEITSLCERFHLRRREIYEIAIGGNATMRDLVFGLDVQGIGQKPYKSSIENQFRAGERVSMAIEALAADLGMFANKHTRAYGLPLLASHVGGDVAADILALGLLEPAPHPRMLVDIGTNTEVVIAHDGRLVCASCPAGPAFEGGGVEHGMPGYDGAIERIEVADDGSIASVQVIGGGEPSGICGSGLVDLLAGLRRAGVLGPKGTFEGVPRGAKLTVDERHAITLSRADVSHLAQAKAANYCGQYIVLRALGLDAGDIATLYVAGGFANYLDLDNAIAIGFLAPVPRERIHKAGNAALDGVRRALLSVSARRRLEEATAHVEHIELETTPDFFEIFVEACRLEPMPERIASSARAAGSGQQSKVSANATHA